MLLQLKRSRRDQSKPHWWKKKTAFGLSYLSTLASVNSCLSAASSQDWTAADTLQSTNVPEYSGGNSQSQREGEAKAWASLFSCAAAVQRKDWNHNEPLFRQLPALNRNKVLRFCRFLCLIVLVWLRLPSSWLGARFTTVVSMQLLRKQVILPRGDHCTRSLYQVISIATLGEIMEVN